MHPKLQILENFKKKYWSHIGHINIAPPISGEGGAIIAAFTIVEEFIKQYVGNLMIYQF